ALPLSRFPSRLASGKEHPAALFTPDDSRSQVCNDHDQAANQLFGCVVRPNPGADLARRAAAVIYLEPQQLVVVRGSLGRNDARAPQIDFGELIERELGLRLGHGLAPWTDGVARNRASGCQCIPLRSRAGPRLQVPSAASRYASRAERACSARGAPQTA